MYYEYFSPRYQNKCSNMVIGRELRVKLRYILLHGREEGSLLSCEQYWRHIFFHLSAITDTYGCLWILNPLPQETLGTLVTTGLHNCVQVLNLNERLLRTKSSPKRFFQVLLFLKCIFNWMIYFISYIKI